MELIRLTVCNEDELFQLWQRASLPLRVRGRDNKSAIEFQMRATPDFFLGAFEGSRLVGAVVASSDGRKGEINRLAVDPDYRRKGIAEALITEAEQVLRQQGIHVFSALIADSNAASQRLFTKCGYVENKAIRYFSKRDHNDV
jgi:ribosomal protein S18 acetylase RimI-like enzyme